ncbi:MAG: glycosyltransferase family A protein [Ignavibacteria bacterium]
MSSGFRSVSIIIPTYNRANILRTTLESCVNQSYPKDKFEILVVDNNSSDNTKEVVEEWSSGSDIRIKYIFEERQGAHFARNTAARQSESEILYYTDDDMVADKDMLINIVKVFDMDYNIAVAGGKVLPKWEFDPPEWLLKYFKNAALSLIDKSEKLIIASYDIGIYSCHQAILKDVLLKCGGFNPDIEKDKLVGNGETGLNLKILEAGYNFAYVNDAVSYHLIPRSRMTQKYLNSRFSNQGNCDSFTTFRRNENSKKVLLKQIVLSHIPNLFKYFTGSLTKKWASKDIWRLDRVYAYYFLQRIKADYKFATDENWRKYAVKYDYLNE